jgi:7-keto-8-aminopelargonate synthetase-like enzyme
MQKMGHVIGSTPSPISPFTGDDETIALWQEPLAEGLYVNLILPPGCSRDDCLLRASCSAAPTTQPISKALDILERARVGVGVTA